jgi:hypothetical protein
MGKMHNDIGSENFEIRTTLEEWQVLERRVPNMHYEHVQKRRD